MDYRVEVLTLAVTDVDRVVAVNDIRDKASVDDWKGGGRPVAIPSTVTTPALLRSATPAAIPGYSRRSASTLPRSLRRAAPGCGRRNPRDRHGFRY